MRCDRCGRDAIVFQRYSGLHLCGDHLQRDLVARAKRTIRARGWIRTGDRIAVALSGGRSSGALLHFLSAHFGNRPDLSLVAITVDEGTGSGRDMNRIARLAEGMGIEWAGTSLAEEFGSTLDGIPAAGDGNPACLCCGVLRGCALISLAGRMGATRLALGTHLDDEARAVFLSVLRGEAVSLIRPPRLGDGRISLVRPFLRIPGQEVALYARLNTPGCDPDPGPRAPDPLENEAGRILDEYTNRHPGAMFSLVNLGEALSEGSVPESGEPRPCTICREQFATSCPARQVLDRVKGHG